MRDRSAATNDHLGWDFRPYRSTAHRRKIRCMAGSLVGGWNRTEFTTLTGARTWCGHGVFAHNLVKISALAA